MSNTRKVSLLVRLKRIIKKNYGLMSIIRYVQKVLSKIHNSNNKVFYYGGGRIRKDIIGRNNIIFIAHDAYLKSTLINIRGDNNRIEFGENVKVGKVCSFFLEGNNIRISIGRDTSFTQTCHFNAQEDNMSIEVGEDCMFSNQIIVRTSDAHPIYDGKTKERINPPKDVKVGKHVWIAPNTIIMKGADIGDGCIIGSNTMVSKSIPANSLAVGMPAKVVKENIFWTRENLFPKSSLFRFRKY